MIARRSSSLPIFERPAIPSFRASSFSSLRVFASPLRTAAASLPSAERVLFGRFFNVCFRFAPACAFLTLRRAAARCFAVAVNASFYPLAGASGTVAPVGSPAGIRRSGALG